MAMVSMATVSMATVSIATVGMATVSMSIIEICVVGVLSRSPVVAYSLQVGVGLFVCSKTETYECFCFVCVRVVVISVC